MCSENELEEKKLEMRKQMIEKWEKHPWQMAQRPWVGFQRGSKGSEVGER